MIRNKKRTNVPSLKNDELKRKEKTTNSCNFKKRPFIKNYCFPFSTSFLDFSVFIDKIIYNFERQNSFPRGHVSCHKNLSLIGSAVLKCIGSKQTDETDKPNKDKQAVFLWEGVLQFSIYFTLSFNGKKMEKSQKWSMPAAK